MIFVYDKKDDTSNKVSMLDFVSCSFLEKERTAGYTTTFRLRQMLEDGAIKEDIIAYLYDKHIPADEMTIEQISEQIMQVKPNQGFLTISNALQWRLQYARVVALKEQVGGVFKLVDKINK